MNYICMYVYGYTYINIYNAKKFSQYFLYFILYLNLVFLYLMLYFIIIRGFKNSILIYIICLLTWISNTLIVIRSVICKNSKWSGKHEIDDDYGIFWSTYSSFAESAT